MRLALLTPREPLRRLRRLRALLPALLVLAPTYGHAQPPADPAQTLFQLANADRARYALPPLTWSPALARAARTHALLLAQHPGQLEHQLPGEPDLPSRAATTGARFETVSENLASSNTSLPEVPGDVSTRLAAIEDGWLHSPTHRHNLLNPALDQVGIAVVPARGLLYIVQDFARGTPALTLPAIERSLAHALLDRGLTLVQLSDTARLACQTRNPTGNQTSDQTSNQYPQDPTRGTPRSTVQWDSPDPTTLPAELLQALSDLHPRTALLGACPGQQPPFTTWRVTVLLY